MTVKSPEDMMKMVFLCILDSYEKNSSVYGITSDKNLAIRPISSRREEDLKATYEIHNASCGVGATHC